MKAAFKSFGLPDEKTLKSAWTSEKTIFVFDANVFLNIYGYEEQTKNDFFEALTAVSKQIWIPHQAGLEYHRRRLDVIKQEKKTFRDVNSALDKILSDATESLRDRKFWQKIPALEKQLSELTNAISVEINKCKDRVLEWDKLQPDVRSADQILDKIDALTADKIGPMPPDQLWLDKIFSEGKSRFELKIPPGFQDAAKGKGEASETTFTYNKLKYQREFGDLIIWMQLLEKVKTDSIQNVFFITDDSKTDWWTTIDSGGKKIIGPHEGLRNEFYHETNADLFHMYNTTNFLTQSKQFLNTKVLDTSIEDINNKSNSASENSKTRKSDIYSIFIDNNTHSQLFPKETLPEFSAPDLNSIKLRKPNLDTPEFEIKLNKNTNELEVFIKDSELSESIQNTVSDNRIRNYKNHQFSLLKKLLRHSEELENKESDES